VSRIVIDPALCRHDGICVAECPVRLIEQESGACPTSRPFSKSRTTPRVMSQSAIRSLNGDCARLAREMEGFHAQIVYGDYLREVGYVLKKTKATEWKNYSEDVGRRT
jgi:ferredoxin